MHSMRATLTTHGHTPYTCVYTPIYPRVLHGPIRKPDVLPVLIQAQRITIRIATGYELKPHC